MNRTFRNGLGAAFLIAVAACTFDVAFDMAKGFAAAATGTSLNTNQTVDLGQYREVQDHKGSVTHLQLQSVDATVTSVAQANKATKVSGKLTLRAPNAPTDGSQDVLVGQLTNQPITQGATFHLPGNSALDDFLLQQLKGSGTFNAVISVVSDGETHVTIHAILHANMGYSGGPF
jgi:hypothetical protein